MPRSNDPRFGALLRQLIRERGLTFRALAERTHYGKSYIHDLASGRSRPSPDAARRLDDALRANGVLAALAFGTALAGDELDAIELGRRVAASDVSAETLDQLEAAFDDLASAYATTPPEVLLPRVRRHVDYVTALLDARKTLTQQRRLLALGGWLALLSATLRVDLRQSDAAASWLKTASGLGDHAEHAEIRAWCLETRAWEVLTAGDFRAAARLSQHAQAIAPAGSSAHIQAVAQEGRAWARMGDQRATRRALERLHRLVAALPAPDRPEHHYRYDPDKALAYTATTLAWSGDPAAEEYARMAIQQLNGSVRPRRIASARLDLSLALVGADKLDEATAQAIVAVTSGRVVASNWWRVTEVLAAIEATGIGEAAELRDAYETFRPAVRPAEAPDSNGH
jgi:transcriptional regulator with XRE-family HTH domain